MNSTSAKSPRLSRWMNRTAFAAFATTIVLLGVSMPIDAWMGAVREWVDSLGFWAPLGYAVLYGCAATLFFPGSALSVAAGAVFGLWKGTLVVWAGANLATVVSFVIARHLARSRVEAMARTKPRFAEVDRALGNEGWKIVALMRLSPLFPFSLQNYLFGVTAIRFWPYAVASGVFMIPGTFLYVYLGYAGGRAAAVTGGHSETDMVKLGGQVLGLLATILVTVLVARIAARAIARQAPAKSRVVPPEQRADPPSIGRSAVLLAIACASLITAIFVFVNREWVRERLSPYSVQPIRPITVSRVDQRRNGGQPGPQVALRGAFDRPSTRLQRGASRQSPATEYAPDLAQPAAP